MKTLAQLARLRRYRLLERQRLVSQLEAADSALKEKDRALGEELEREVALAGVALPAGLDLGAYLARVRRARGRIDGERRSLADKIAAARGDLNAAFRELKKTEILAERAAEAERLAALVAEQAELDEISSSRHGIGRDLTDTAPSPDQRLKSNDFSANSRPITTR